MTESTIPLERIRPNAMQVRKTFHGIEELARSIAKYGLLQNLVVRELSEPGTYELVAGERRYRALTLLAGRGELSPPEARCLVISSKGELEAIVENGMRQDVAVWELGAKYQSFYDAGMTQAQIAAAVHRSQGHVSTAMILARNLAPALIVRLSELPPHTFPTQRLLRIAALVDGDGEPKEGPQLELFSKMLELPRRRGRRAGRPHSQKEMVWQRFQRLSQGKVGLRVDPVHQPFLDQLIKYLAGEAKGVYL